MAKLGINTGSTPDAGDGDSLLVGAIKINSNFDELYNVLGDGTNISNTIGYASTSGISTLSQGLSGTPNITVGIVTASFINVTGSGTSTTQLRVTGVSTLSTTNISGDLTFTGSNDIYLKDNGVANFGNSNDLQIYHNGSFSVIKDDGTGGLVVYSDGVGIGTENITNTLTVAGSGTSTSQLYVTGVSTFQNDIKVAEYSYGTNSNQITLGDNKFRIYADGSNTYLKNYDSNTGGDLYIETDELLIRKYNGTETIAQFTEGAGVKLNYQGITKFQTTSSGITVTGTTLTNQLDVGLPYSAGGLNVTGISTFVGIATAESTLFANQLSVSGIATASSFSGSGAGLTSIPAAQLTGALPAIDGSALINVTASGTGIIIADDGTPVGTAGTIDFGTGIIVSPVSAGIVTVTSTGGGGGESYWEKTSVGINTLSKVGIGTTNPTSALTVVGSGTSTSQLYVTGISTFVSIPSFDSGISFSDDSSGLPTAATRNIEVSIGFTKRFIFRTNKVEFFSFSDYYSGFDHFIFEISKTGDVTAAGNLRISGITTTSRLNVGTGGTVITTTASGLVGINTANPQTPLQVENVYGVKTGSGTFTATAGIGYTADSYAVSDFVNAEYTLFFQHSTGIQSQKVLVMDDGTTAYSQEYGIMSSNDLLVSVGATVNSGNVELWWTPETGISGIVTYRYTRETMI